MSKVKSGIWNLESGIWNLELKALMPLRATDVIARSEATKQSYKSIEYRVLGIEYKLI